MKLSYSNKKKVQSSLDSGDIRILVFTPTIKIVSTNLTYKNNGKKS